MLTYQSGVGHVVVVNVLDGAGGLDFVHQVALLHFDDVLGPTVHVDALVFCFTGEKNSY